MKNHTRLLLTAAFSFAAGLVFFAVANAQFTAGLRLDVILSVTAAAAVVGLMIFDYSRRPHSLTPPTQLLRPVALARPATCVEARCDRLAA